ncbi:MAG: hypothetical protein B6D72_19645 [gamma proteobacterium symbiont of Ctena orbiculata]|uniref:Rubredoxin-like domain-containing protein n=1 Tax=Candidatus Thiodiazotropha taylori TaxID=2792791 RepID=A0A944MBJ0_9GAMM|nr:hypothetical protein [Candidatus Thiodiazotropha taylori]PVV06242.1 MAG: hypothetical protein B6D82_18435 [gamma proteobacterium symbiont of Ctena orbiculata]MBT2990610.1 hypothetical protein [Candidatus Thiodiazotropha taylori]MBT2998094.1 hypothetical protein [Candidatus Thiodiazotropha taylori]MBT3002393.1 hypothetical protein [Candidatus Thiodiazotropha taylori]
MNFGGLLARAALLKEQMKKKPCKRCGLLYDPKNEATCPHCGDLDERGLEKLLEKREKEFHGNRRLGIWFIVTATVLLVLVLLIGGL